MKLEFLIMHNNVWAMSSALKKNGMRNNSARPITGPNMNATQCNEQRRAVFKEQETKHGRARFWDAHPPDSYRNMGLRKINTIGIRKANKVIHLAFNKSSNVNMSFCCEQI